MDLKDGSSSHNQGIGHPTCGVFILWRNRPGKQPLADKTRLQLQPELPFLLC